MRSISLCGIAAAVLYLAASAGAVDGDQLQEIQVTAERLGLLGTANSASEGIVVNEELALTPAYRVGQLLETVPGLQVTSHSGEGKANQYLLRGYNLDHGTDLAIFVDGMPVNLPTHAHGQGYADLNFLIPELATDVRFAKGTYYAQEGDFSSVGSVHINLLDSLANQISLTAGTWGYQRLFAAGSGKVAGGQLLGALELQRYQGPWVHADDVRKVNAVARYSTGDDNDGFTLTAMHYHGTWNATTDQPERAIEEGLISRYGTLDPSDGGEAQRRSLTFELSKPWAGGELRANAYVIGNRLTLWNDFTHWLSDPVNGDQEAQREDRTVIGATLGYRHAAPIFGLDNEVSGGLATRNDFNNVSREPSRARIALPAGAVPLGFHEADTVRLSNLSTFLEATTHWTERFRSVLGLRFDSLYGSDTGSNRGHARDQLLAPKGSLIFRPLKPTELYLSAGRGFHSDDLRGVTAAAAQGIAGAPLIARQSGEEFGVRQQFGPAVSMTFALYTLSAESETTYDPDVGVDGAGPGSRRRGYESNLTYQATRWLEIYASYSGDHARFTSPYDDGTGHVGRYLPNAPVATGSFNLYVKDLGPWSGSLGYRYLSAFPLSSDNAIKGHGYGEWSGDARRIIGSGFSVAVAIYNLLDKRAQAAEFWYVDRLPRETAAGVADVHLHPLEGRSLRVTLEKSF